MDYGTYTLPDGFVALLAALDDDAVVFGVGASTGAGVNFKVGFTENLR